MSLKFGNILLVQKDKMDKETSAGCRKGAGQSFLCPHMYKDNREKKSLITCLPGVNVMIAIFDDFDQFPAENWHFSLKKQCCYSICCINSH
jgi:hypothetical protein